MLKTEDWMDRGGAYYVSKCTVLEAVQKEGKEQNKKRKNGIISDIQLMDKIYIR